MSRTKKGKKGYGSEYRGKRPLSKKANSGGTKDKRAGTQRERAILKRQKSQP
jgi:hypothetical protein